MKTRKPFVLIVLLGLAITSCGQPNLATYTPTLHPSMPPSFVPTDTIFPSAPLTESPIPTHLPSLTPLPTFLPDKSEEVILELMGTNDGCTLPCWWGITPGISLMFNEEQRLRQFMFLQAESSSEDPTEYSGADFYYSDGDRVGSVYLLAQRGAVIGMGVSGFYIITQNYAIQDVLRKYSTPDEIWIYTWPESMGENVLHFTVTLDYSSKGFLVYYFSEMGEFVPGTGTNQLCYSRDVVPPKIIIWDPSGDNPFAINNWDRIYEIWDQMKPIEEATGMSKEQFVNWFVNGAELQEYCIQTPASIWRSP